MSRDGIKILLGSLKYKSAPNSNLTIPIPFEQNVKELIQYDRISNVDLVQVYNDERNLSKIYRPTFKLDLLFKNLYVGTTNYPPFENNLYYVNENKAAYLTCSVINDISILPENKNDAVIWSGYPQYNEFDFIRTDYNVSGYTKAPGILPGLTEQINFNFTSAGTYNWEFYLTYPFSSTTLQMNTYFDPKENGAQAGYINWNANEGIPFRITVGYDDNVTYQGTRVIRFSSPVKHGLSPGEFVKLKIYIGNNINTNRLPYSTFSSSLDTFQVFSLGNGQYGTDDYVFNIANLGYTNAQPNGATFNQDNEGVAKRVISIENTGDTTSKYYVRLHKVLVPPEEIILTKAGFENNIFGINKKYESASTTPDYKSRVSIKEGAQTYNITLNKDLDTSNIFDNQKRPISELFLTTIWKGYLGWTYGGPTGANPNYLKRGWDYNLGMKNSDDIYVKFPINTTGDTSFPPEIPILEREIIQASVPLPQAFWGTSNSGLNRSNIGFTSYTRNNKTFYYVNSLKKDDIIDGDFCEWNESEQIERVISKVNHKIYFNPANFSFYPYITANVENLDDDILFNVQMPNIQPTTPIQFMPEPNQTIAIFTAFTPNTEYINNPYGYYYNPHNSIKIKEFSEYIETAERSVLDIPNYAYFSKFQNLFIWRDFLPYGINNPNSNGINYPFVNNAHYPYTSINFRLIPEGTTYWYDNTTTQDSPITDNCE